MVFKEARNCYLVINRPQSGGAVRVYPPLGKTLQAYIGPPSGGRGISDYVPLPIEQGGGADPTDVIVFDVPTSEARIDLKGNEELTVSDADAQVNGIYGNVGRPNRSRSTEPDIPTHFRLYVRRIRDS